MRFIEMIRLLDWPLLLASVLLVLIGLSMLMSETFGQSALSDLFLKQLFAAGVGLILSFVVARVPYHVWSRYALALYGVGIVGLLSVALGGKVIRGTISRLEFIGFQVQPSEVMKLAVVVVLAWLLYRYKSVGIRQVVISGAFTVVPVALVLQEPDVGIASIILATWLSVIFFLGLSMRTIAILLLVVVLAATAGWQWFFLGYQKDRILTFLHPAKDPLQAGYSITQSMIAVGSGQFVGRGLGHGPQSQLKFLPERHTDFIFASIGEELGFVGIFVVVSLYAVVLRRLFIIAKSTRDSFGQVLGMGVFIVVLLGIVISAGMNVGLLPVTGIPLPLVSYGGSNLVVTLVLIGMVQSIRVYSRYARTPPVEIQGIV